MTWVHEGIYAAGGDHIPRTWSDFADQTRIRAILHLRPGSPDRFDGRLPEAFLWLDVEGEEQAGLAERELAGKFIAECVASGRKLLLHSSLGRHRVRWAMVAFRILSGRSAQAALREAEDRPWLAPYHTDRLQWNTFEARVRGRPG